VMMGLENMDEIPFYDVFIHGTILDGNGERMSKSKGNGIDPLDIIKTYGADAMRFSLAQMTTESQDMRLPVTKDENGRNVSEKFDIGRNFCNKLWNASRFAMMNLDGIDPEAFEAERMTITDKWILSRLADTVAEVTDMLNEFKFSEPLMVIYRFFWNDFCDWYLEWLKPRMTDKQTRPTAQNVLAFVLDRSLGLLHPFIPFITEGIFQQLNKIVPSRALKTIASADVSDALIVAGWPDKIDSLRDCDIEEEISIVQTLIRSIREIRNKYAIAPGKKLTASATAPADVSGILNDNMDLICTLAGLDKFSAAADIEKPKTAAAVIIDQMQLFVHGVIDPEAERKRLEKQRKQILGFIKSSQAKLSNENFVTKARPEIVTQVRDKLAELKEQQQTIQQHLLDL